MNILENYNRMVQVVQKYRKNPSYDHVEIKLIKSKTSNSVYLKVISMVGNHYSRRTMRYSDHPANTNVKAGKCITKKISSQEFERNLYGMIKSINRERLRMILG